MVTAAFRDCSGKTGGSSFSDWPPPTPSVAIRAYALVFYPSSIGFDQSQKRVSSHPGVVIVVSIIPRNGGIYGTLRRRQRGGRVLVKEDDQL
jgi:hypothetical protein